MLAFWLAVVMLFFPRQEPASGASKAPLAAAPVTNQLQQGMMRKGREEAERHPPQSPAAGSEIEALVG